MSNHEKVIKVDTLVIHAKEVKVIEERREKDDRHERKDPWGLFWGRRAVEDVRDDEEYDKE
ncbi:hypothetical protein ACNRWW_11235 [Metabacillus sp. HB246100]|uniref:hypothetical protein n=1 Tax=Bacillus weihaiensis TaxID=1547283 RepID=UPI002352F665|nr:hypothetical protein [Bacillus weihaiensis]